MDCVANIYGYVDDGVGGSLYLDCYFPIRVYKTRNGRIRGHLYEAYSFCQDDQGTIYHAKRQAANMGKAVAPSVQAALASRL